MTRAFKAGSPKRLRRRLIGLRRRAVVSGVVLLPFFWFYSVLALP
jgi:hypothetical protein